MNIIQNHANVLNVLHEEGAIEDVRRTKFYFENLLSDFDFENKRVLEIGSGSGQLTFYVASQGASEVICLEPEADGSKNIRTSIFTRIQKRLGYQEIVKLEPMTIQDFSCKNNLFDIIILHNSINHLDENACINLLRGEEYYKIYQSIFSKIFSMAKNDSKILIHDCSRENFFKYIKLSNPFAKTIEWNKHQKPETWIHLLRSVGFNKPKIRWTPVSRLFSLGKKLTGNRLVAFFIGSYFSLIMEKSEIEQ